MMLTFTQLESELSRYTYRPDWKLTLWDDHRQGILLHIVVVVVNSYDPTKTVTLRINSWVPPMQSTTQFAHWLFWRLRQIEIHECMEWFKRDGVPMFDPHKDIDPPMTTVTAKWDKFHPNTPKEV